MMLLYFIAVLQLLSLTGASESGIVGGDVSKPHSRRYMAELQCRGGHVCGGILIRKDFVLTSAHCKKDCKINDMMVVLGAHNITKDEKSQQKISVAKYLPHPEYKGKFQNDIMLLKLKPNAKLTKNVKPIQLPKETETIHANTTCLVAGWGRTDHSAPASDVLRETTVKMEAGAECKIIWLDYFSTDQMICTHTDGKKAGICQGDSGGPLICAGKLHGISAFTSLPRDGGCDDPRYPHVFIKVPIFSQWIKKEMKG